MGQYKLTWKAGASIVLAILVIAYFAPQSFNVLIGAILLALALIGWSVAAIFAFLLWAALRPNPYLKQRKEVIA